MRLAVLCSSGGGVLDALGLTRRSGRWPYEIAGIITDRPCGAEKVAQMHGVPCERIDPPQSHTWSTRASEALMRWSPDAVLLLMLRKVGPEIWRDLELPVWNLHPSLLPAYPGLHALERNYADAVDAANRGEETRMGATIHVVTDAIDAGPIISQRFFTINDGPTLAHAQHICFLHKVALVLECICKLIDGTLPTWREADDPRPWHERYALWKPYESITVVQRRLAQPWAVEWIDKKSHEGAAKLVAKVLHARTSR